MISVAGKLESALKSYVEDYYQVVALGAFTANATTDVLTFGAVHGLLAGDRVQVSTTGVLPGGMAADTYYFVIASGLTTTAAKVSTTAGGAALDLTSVGTGVHSASFYHPDLLGVTLYEGRRGGVNDEPESISFVAGAQGGPLARVGNYEIEVLIVINTNGCKQTGETDLTRIDLHEARVEALAAIFGEAQLATVKAALTVIDAEMGVNAFWGYDRELAMGKEDFRTVLRKTFDCYLV